MKTLLFLLIVTVGLGQIAPAIPGQRIVIELSTDMQTWTMIMPYNSPRGFLRARPETCATFVPWITAVDAPTGADLNLFANGVRNSSCWASGVDLTPLAVGGLNAGILISPRHVLFVTHYYPAIGTELAWMTAANDTITRTLTAFSSLTETSGFYPDLTVGLLSEDVPSTIGIARVLDDGELPSSWQGYCVPVVVRNRADKLSVADIQTWANSITLAAPASNVRSAKYHEMVSGDSGSPVCLIHENKLVLVALVTYGGPGRGANIARHRDAINAVMSSLGGGYQLSVLTP